MALRDVLQEAKALSIEERRELIKLLVDTLTANEPGAATMPTEPSMETLLQPGIAHEVWSPHDSFKAAQQLQDMLEEYNRDNDQP